MGKREAPPPAAETAQLEQTGPGPSAGGLCGRRPLCRRTHCLFRAPEIPGGGTRPDGRRRLPSEDTKLEDAAVRRPGGPSRSASPISTPFCSPAWMTATAAATPTSSSAVDGQNGYHLRRQHPPGHQGRHQRQRTTRSTSPITPAASDLLADTISEQLGIPVDFTVAVDLHGL